MQEWPHNCDGFCRPVRFRESRIHQLHPAIASLLIDDERHVPHSQTRMSALVNIGFGSSKSIDQKIGQSFLGMSQSVRWIHRSQQVIAGNATIELRDQSAQSCFADEVVNRFWFGFAHRLFSHRFGRVRFHRRGDRLARAIGNQTPFL